MKCGFCSATKDVESCRWSVMRYMPARYSELVEGDIVARWTDLRSQPPVARVESITPVDPFYRAGGHRLVLRIGTRVKEATVIGTSPVRVLRPDTCDTPCCPLHRCERGPNSIYCQDHWRLQLQEAS